MRRTDVPLAFADFLSVVQVLKTDPARSGILLFLLLISRINIQRSGTTFLLSSCLYAHFALEPDVTFSRRSHMRCCSLGSSTGWAPDRACIREAAGTAATGPSLVIGASGVQSTSFDAGTCCGPAQQVTSSSGGNWRDAAIAMPCAGASASTASGGPRGLDGKLIERSLAVNCFAVGGGGGGDASGY